MTMPSCAGSVVACSVALGVKPALLSVASAVPRAWLTTLGTVVVERETLFKLDDDAFEHLSRARDSFRQRKPVEAAVQTREVAIV